MLRMNPLEIFSMKKKYAGSSLKSNVVMRWMFMLTTDGYIGVFMYYGFGALATKHIA